VSEFVDALLSFALILEGSVIASRLEPDADGTSLPVSSASAGDSLSWANPIPGINRMPHIPITIDAFIKRTPVMTAQI
tara:strand:+ start:825 stop:1058 length:234 start_codon:yes stop_codon:yes gene_type:complete